MSDCSIMARSNRFIHRPNIRSQSLPKTHKQLGNREESIYSLLFWNYDLSWFDSIGRSYFLSFTYQFGGEKQ